MRGCLRFAHGFPRFVDVILGGAGEAADDGRLCCHPMGSPPPRAIRLHRFQIIGRGGGESRFDDVHAQLRQRARHFHLLDGRHRRARRLLAVA